MPRDTLTLTRALSVSSVGSSASVIRMGEPDELPQAADDNTSRGSQRGLLERRELPRRRPTTMDPTGTLAEGSAGLSRGPSASGSNTEGTRVDGRQPPLAPLPTPAPDGLTDRFASLAGCPTVYKPLPPSWAKPFVAAAASCARAYIDQPSEQAVFDFLCLPKVGLAPALKLASSSTGAAGKAHLAAFPLVEWPSPNPAPARESPLPARVSKAVAQGKLSRAARLLADDAAVAPLDEDTLEALHDKHPTGDVNPFGARRGTPPSSLPELALIRDCFAAFKPDTAPGVSGWTPPLLGHVLHDSDVAAFVVLLTRHVAQGVAPGQQLLCMSRLTPLLKSDGGIRPIAVGELLYRLVAKSLVRHYSAPSQLLPWQFGVGSPGGTEPITRAIERAIDFDLLAPFRHVTSLDFSNAFNSLSRRELGKGVLQHAPALFRASRWAYNIPTILVVSAVGGDPPSLLASSEGVRQGDPLGPLLFSIGARNTLAALEQHLGPGHAMLAYLDDVYILSEEPGALDSAAAFLDGNGAGLSLNLAKCHETPLAIVAQDGLEVLGTCIGPPDVRASFLAAQVEAQLPALSRLADLPGQEALLVLRHCLASNLRHLQRSLRTDDLPGAWDRLDEALLARFLAIRSSPRRLVSDAGLVSLPARLGGMGLLSHAEVSPHARAAMAESADAQLKVALAASDPVDPAVDVEDEPALPTSQRARCQTAFIERREVLLASLPSTDRAAVLDNASPIARRWLSAIPFAANLRLTSSEVAAGLSIRTLCPGQDDHCPHCALPNVTGHDDVCSARPLWRVARHEHVKGLLLRHLGAIAGTRVSLEPFVPGSHQRTDLRVTGPGSFGGPVSEYDISVVSAATLAGRDPVARADLAGLPSAFLPTGVSADVAPRTAVASASLLNQLTIIENQKRAKYEGRTSAPFFPVVLSTGGTLSPSTVSLFAHWRGLMPRYGLFSRLLSLSLVRARARFFAF